MVNVKHFLFLFFALLITGSAFSQVPDTVVVYEYVHVTDTVWVEREVFDFKKLESISNATLLLDTTAMNANLLIFSSGKTATIPINRILLTENNQKLKSMKKITLFGLAFLAMNTSLFAQDQHEKSIGIHFRANSIAQKEIYFLEEGHTSGSLHFRSILGIDPTLGIMGNLSINKYFSFSPRVSYMKIEALTADGFIGVKKVDNEKLFWNVGSELESMLQEKGYEIFTTTYNPSYTKSINAISTDIFLNCNILEVRNFNCRLFGGLRLDLFIQENTPSAVSASENNLYKKTVFNYAAGIGFDIKKRVYLELEYSKNMNPYAETSVMKAYYTTASLNLGYYLFRY